jgi:hypothetical protein
MVSLPDMKKLLIICYSNLNSDPRILRHYNALKNNFQIYTAGLADLDPSLPFVKLEAIAETPRYSFHLKLPVFLRKIFSLLIRLEDGFRRNVSEIKRKSGEQNKSSYFERKYWKQERLNALAALSVNAYDIILANDIDTLPMALGLKGPETKIIIDCHEYHPLEFEEDVSWVKETKPYNEYLCKEYLPKADLMFTVCKGIASKYASEYSLNPVVITNAASYAELHPSPTAPDNIRMIHHGVGGPSRQIERMIDLFMYLDHRFSLDLMLVSLSKEYRQILLDRIGKNTKVRLIEPVSTQMIVSKLNSYDIGLYILPPVNFNSKYALPNKLFEFIQARLAIAIGPSPEMAYYVKKYKLGIVSETFEAECLAKELNKLTASEIEAFKNNVDGAAFELSAEKNGTLIREMAQKIVS